MWTDDPVADADRYFAKKEEELKKLPRCSECDHPIQNEYCFEFNGELICDECMHSNHRKQVEDFME